MYDELVKRLRASVDGRYEKCDCCPYEEDYPCCVDCLDKMHKQAADAIEDDAVTMAYSYIGPAITHPMYADGSIGKAKDDLFATAKQMTSDGTIKAYISVNKALVTQSSAAIPIVPLYIGILFKVMKEQGCHEGCIEQMCRLFNEKLYGGNVETDDENRIRMDDLEMQDHIQAEVNKLWDKINTDNIAECADLDGYFEDFYKLFGFGADGIDYEADTNADVKIPSITE